MKRVAMAALLLLPALPAFAQDSDASAPMAADGIVRVKSGPAPISAVTVYPDGALVTRTAKTSLPAGVSIVVFDDLTPSLDEASLRARLNLGGGSTKVTGVSADWQGNVVPLRDAEAKFTSQLEKIQADLQSERDKQQALASRRQVLEQYRTLSHDAIGESAGDGTKTTVPGDKGAAKWSAALAWLTKEQAAIATDQRASQLRVQDLNEKYAAASAELNKIHASADIRTRRVEVEVESAAAVDAEIALDYVVAGASWAPAYDARQGATELALTCYGTVTQATGEDWNRIALTLSTARPAEGAQVPTLLPVQLTGAVRQKRPVQIVSYGKKKAKEQDKDGETTGNAEQNGRASVDDHGTAVVFRIEGKESLPADRRPHKVEIATLPLKSELVWETIPKIAPYVYLKSTARNKGTFPLLAGEVNVFRSSGYVGTSHLEYIAPGEEFAVSLGIDDDLKVHRIIDEHADTKPKILGTTRTITYAYSIDLSNYKDGPQAVTVVENIPVTQRKEIKIGLREGTTKPDKQDDEGFVKWKVDLKPGETRTVFFGYTVEYPKDFQLGGL